MPNYRRASIPGGTWFFTVNLLQRRNNDLLVREIDRLRAVVRQVRQGYPFRIDASVVLPEHLHAVRTAPPGDSNCSGHWRLIKSGFSRACPKPSGYPQSAAPLANAAFGNGTLGALGSR